MYLDLKQTASAMQLIQEIQGAEEILVKSIPDPESTFILYPSKYADEAGVPITIIFKKKILIHGRLFFSLKGLSKSRFVCVDEEETKISDQMLMSIPISIDKAKTWASEKIHIGILEVWERSREGVEVEDEEPEEQEHLPADPKIP